MSLETYELDKKMLEYSISQFRNIPEYVKMCEAFAVGVESIQGSVDYLSDMIDLSKAEGVWLDYIGWLVGRKRDDFLNLADYFCVNKTGVDENLNPIGDVNKEKLFWFANQSTNQQMNLTDEIYRGQIYGKIGYNISKSTRNENIKIIKNITMADHVIIDNVEPMVLDITLYGDNILQFQGLRQTIESILGNGVGIDNLEIKGLDEYGN